MFLLARTSSPCFRSAVTRIELLKRAFCNPLKLRHPLLPMIMVVLLLRIEYLDVIFLRARRDSNHRVHPRAHDVHGRATVAAKPAFQWFSRSRAVVIVQLQHVLSLGDLEFLERGRVSKWPSGVVVRGRTHRSFVLGVCSKRRARCLTTVPAMAEGHANRESGHFVLDFAAKARACTRLGRRGVGGIGHYRMYE